MPVRVLHRLAHVAEQPEPADDGRRVRAQYSVSGAPSTYSITNHGVPSASESAS